MNDISTPLLFHQTNMNYGTCTDNVQMISISMEALSLDKFFKDVETVKNGLNDIENIHKRLQIYRQGTKSTYSNYSNKQELNTQMTCDVELALNKVKSTIFLLQSLHGSNLENLKLPGCGKGSSSDRTRTFIVSELKEKLQEIVKKFNTFREKIAHEHRSKNKVDEVAYGEEQTVEIITMNGSEDGKGRGSLKEKSYIEKMVIEMHDAVMKMKKMKELKYKKWEEKKDEFQKGKGSNMETMFKVLSLFYFVVFFVVIMVMYS